MIYIHAGVGQPWSGLSFSRSSYAGFSNQLSITVVTNEANIFAGACDHKIMDHLMASLEVVDKVIFNDSYLEQHDTYYLTHVDTSMFSA